MATGKNPLFDTATTLGKILLFLGVSAICGVLVAGLLVPAAAVSGSAASGSIQFFDTLPAELKVDPPSQSTTILASDGSVIANLYAENRTRVSLDQMSPYIKDAIIAIEDSRFYEHGGVDTTGILRALVSTARGNKQGASTITQQYVNNVINSSLEAEGKGDEVLLNGVNKGVGRQAPRNEAGHRPGEEVHQGADPRGLPEHRVLQPGRLRHRSRVQVLLQHHRQGPDPAAGRAAGRRREQPVLLRPDHQPGERQGPPRPGAPGHARPRARSSRPTTTPPWPRRWKPRSPSPARAAPTRRRRRTSATTCCTCC